MRDERNRQQHVAKLVALDDQYPHVSFAGIIAPVMNPLTLAAWTAAFFISASLFSHTVALRLLLLLFTAAVLVAALVQQRQALKPLPPIWIPFVLWAAWAALSVAWSEEPQRAGKELLNEIVYTALALWTCFVAAQARNAARIFLPVLAAAAVLACGIALYEFPMGPEPYAKGWHGGPGNHAAVLLMLMPCALMAGWYGGRAGWSAATRTAIWALVGLLLASAYTTLNRTIWVGFALQLVLLGALLRLRHGASPDRVTKVAGAALAAAVIAGGAIMLLHVQAEREASGAGTFLKDPRLTLWPEVLKRIEERPLTGHGFGRGAIRKSLRENIAGADLLWHSHNLFLEATVQLGIPGLVLLLALLGATVREGWKSAMAPDDAAAACGIALVAVVAGMVVRNMTDVLWVRHIALLYWSIVGVLLAWGAMHRARAQA
jgi:O-antigen ligase